MEQSMMVGCLRAIKMHHEFVAAYPEVTDFVEFFDIVVVVIIASITVIIAVCCHYW